MWGAQETNAEGRRNNFLESSAVCRCGLIESLNLNIAMRSNFSSRPNIRVLIGDGTIGKDMMRPNGQSRESRRTRAYIFNNDASEPMTDEDHWCLLLYS